MPITPINKPKNAITPARTSKSGVAAWDDSTVTWDSPTLYWDSPLLNLLTNLAKNVITPINKPKN